jgi:hypothetical protein
MTILKCDRSHSAIIADLIIQLLKDFNERSGSNFNIDRDAILETIHRLIERVNYGCYIAFDGSIL